MRQVLALIAGVFVVGCSDREPVVPVFDAADVIPDAVVVDFKDGITKAEYDAAEGAWGIDVEFNSVAGDASGITLSQGAVPADTAALLATIRKDPRVQFAEPLLRYEALDSASFVPNDPRYAEQWNLKMVGAEAAWRQATGRGVVVAVIDTGIAFEDHEEFRRIEDLDGSRFADGWDFIGDDAHPNDDNGHGTHVAGTIAQHTNNGVGVAGLAYDATLMPLKVLSATGSGNQADIADAIRWAADHGAKVVNLSLGGGPRSAVIENAVAHARKKGVILVAAAGNSGRRCGGNDCTVHYPAAYDGVIAVSAVGPDGALASYSSWGKELDLAAPGGEKNLGEKSGILQGTIDAARPGDTRYDFFQGTSMATPHVAAVAALLVERGVTSPEAVERALYDGAADKGEKGWDPRYGNGLLDANGALLAADGQGVGSRGVATSGVRLALAGALTAMAGASLRRRRAPLAPLGVPFLLGALAASAGLFFLRWTGLTHMPVAGGAFALLSVPMPEWASWQTGTRPTPIFYSVLVPFAAAIVGIPFKTLRAVSAGVAAGWGAFLLHIAWSSPAIAWIDSRPGAVGWLVVNAVLAWILARSLMRFHGELEDKRLRAAGGA